MVNDIRALFVLFMLEESPDIGWLLTCINGIVEVLRFNDTAAFAICSVKIGINDLERDYIFVFAVAADNNTMVFPGLITVQIRNADLDHEGISVINILTDTADKKVIFFLYEYFRYGLDTIAAFKHGRWLPAEQIVVQNTCDIGIICAGNAVRATARRMGVEFFRKRIL